MSDLKPAVLSAVLLALVSGPAFSAPAPSSTATADAAQSGLEVKPGALMYIAQPTEAGHEWRLEPFDVSVLALKAQPDQAVAGALVRGQETEWLFQGGPTGTTELVFTYWKSGEANAPALRTVRYTVNVR